MIYKKLNAILILFLFFIVNVDNILANDKNETTIKILNEDIKIKKDSDLHYKDKKIIRYILSRPATIQGYPCKKDYIWFHENGKIERCNLSKAMTIQNYPCKAYTVTFHNDGKLHGFYLSKAMTIQGFPC